jgi:hypothetical protein
MWWLFAACLLFFIIQYSLIVSLEQETLLNKFGNEYSIYCENVPALIPRLTPWKIDTDATPKPKKIFKPEKSTLLNIVLILLLIFLRSKISS